tara:strand:+ start:996 stop:1283 length:288 start_codon:yes stop_codon:yes gene_type:complete
MSWKDLLKRDRSLYKIQKEFFSPRKFLEHFQEKLGGEIYAGGGRNTAEMKLDYGTDFLKVVSRRGAYFISKKNAVIVNGPSLKELLPIVERNLGA